MSFNIYVTIADTHFCVCVEIIKIYYVIKNNHKVCLQVKNAYICPNKNDAIKLRESFRLPL